MGCLLQELWQRKEELVAVIRSRAELEKDCQQVVLALVDSIATLR